MVCTMTAATAHRPSSFRRKAALAVALAMLTTSCASQNTHVDNMVGGAMGGAIAGAGVGTLCCHDPVKGLPLGILIGGIVGGIVGFIWPTHGD